MLAIVHAEGRVNTTQSLILKEEIELGIIRSGALGENLATENLNFPHRSEQTNQIGDHINSETENGRRRAADGIVRPAAIRNFPIGDKHLAPAVNRTSQVIFLPLAKYLLKIVRHFRRWRVE